MADEITSITTGDIVDRVIGDSNSRSSINPQEGGNTNINIKATRDSIKATMWDFSNCQTYSDLPIVKIMNNPFAMEGPTSYGIICIADDTQTCLMIRRKHSIGLLSILKGFYKREDLPGYILSMNSSERKT